MIQRIPQRRPDPRGIAIDRVRLNALASIVAFAGRRRAVYRRIVALSGARPGDLVLDVGCNGGYLARLMAAAVRPDGRVTGVDPSSAAIGYTSRRAPATCSFMVGVAQDLDLPDGSFDVVTSILAVHHIPEESRAEAFREMYRVTRPGGRLLVADLRPSGRQPWHLRGRARHHHRMGPLDDLVTAAGFRVEAGGDLPILRYVQAVRPTLP